MSDTDDMAIPCPFCGPASSRLFYDSPLVLGIWDWNPVSTGHALLVPRRHFSSWFDSTQEEKSALFDAVDQVKDVIDQCYSPDGYNIGVDIGRSAGQTHFHMHLHVIPRYHDDARGEASGVRLAIPVREERSQRVLDLTAHYTHSKETFLISGGSSEPLARHLKAQLATAVSVDIAVAFVMKSGVDILHSSIVDILSRGGHVRLLTGDYLDATDPVALLQLMDLEPGPGSLTRRVYQSLGTSSSLRRPAIAFHPKAYIFRNIDGSGVAFVGSSNMSRSALQDGVEWNYKIISSRDEAGFGQVCKAFEALFNDPSTTELTFEWIDSYSRRRPATSSGVRDEHAVAPSPETLEIPLPHSIQAEALAALRNSRANGADAGLVVLATGLGKTWLSAFDSRDFERVLFVAHREEILSQAMQTFRRIRPTDYLGHYTGEEKHPDAQVVFASVQTLSRYANLEQFPRSRFDYIVVDEFHHASAATYRRLIGHFEPQFLLGLTATPERSDGADLLELCGGNLVFRCDLAEGIRRGLLCEFDYFGVPDEVDYTNIPWRSRRFDEQQLTTAVATHSRARNALEQLNRRGGTRTLAFCVSQRHADFMAGFFNENGKRAVSVHTGGTSAPRTQSLEQLQAGELDVVCAVDMFNEGVDLPDLDTVMMLRPTESKILWLQQFGRGLRKAAADKRLRVIDYIGNHRTFLLKPQTLFNLGAGDQNIQNLLERYQAGTAEIPPGCTVTYELATIDILKGLLRVSRSPSEALQTYVRDFIDLHGVRPTALEAYREGYAPRSVRQNFGSWFDFLRSMNALNEAQENARSLATAFLKSLEVTPMTKSLKMVVLLAMLNEDKFPGALSIRQLIAAVRRLIKHQPRVEAEFAAELRSDESLQSYLEANPIRAWASGAGTGGESYFDYTDTMFSTSITTPQSGRAALQELTREITEWRLAEYFDRSAPIADGQYVIKVNQASGSPILMPLDREANPGLPEGWTVFIANGQRYRGNFVKVALNTAKKEGGDRNELPSILRQWFGPDAGAPGTRHQVQLAREEDLWTLKPIGAGVVTPVLWKAYSREQIPGLFGLEFNPPVWQQGFVRRGDKTFLLVTLDKSTAADKHKYKDHFITSEIFEWQSQNQTARNSKAGRTIQDHSSMGIEVLLFVRQRSKTNNGKASPFFYCGPVDFVDWSGDRPITVRWRLREAVPIRMRSELSAPD